MTPTDPARQEAERIVDVYIWGTEKGPHIVDLITAALSARDQTIQKLSGRYEAYADEIVELNKQVADLVGALEKYNQAVENLVKHSNIKAPYPFFAAINEAQKKALLLLESHRRQG